MNAYEMSGYTTDDSRRSPSPNGSFYDSTADRRSSFSLAAGDGYGYGNGRWSSLTRDGFRGSTSSLASMGSVQSLQQPRRESVIEALEKKRRDNVSARLRNLQLQLLQRSASVSGGDVEDPMLTTEAAVDLPIIAALPRRGRENVLPRAPRRHSAAYQQVFAGGPFTAGKADDTRSCTDSPASTLRRHSLSTSGLLDGVRGYGRRSLSVFGDATDSDCVDVTSVSPSSVTARHPSALSAAYAADHSSSATCNGRHNGVSQAATDANGLTTLQTETFQSKSLQPAAEEEVYGKSNDRYSVDEENELRSSRVEASSDAAMPSSCHPQQQKEQQRAYLTDDVDVHRSAAALKLQPPRPPTDRLINDRKFTSDDEDYSVDDTAVAESVVSCDDTSVDSFTYCSPAVERNATRRQPSSQQLQQKPQSPDSASFTSTPVDRDIHMPSVEGAQTQLRDRTVPKANRPASLSSFSVRHGDAKTVASSSSLSGALLSPLSATIESPRGRENYDVDRSTGNERLQAAFSYPSIATAVAMSEMSQRGQHQSTSVNDGKRLAKGDETRKPPIYRSAVSLCISTPSPAASVRLRNASTAGLNRPPAAAAASENGRQAHSRSRSDDQTSSLSSSLSDQRHVSELRLPASGRPQPAASSSTLAVAPASPTFKSSFSVPLLTQTTSDFQESTPRNSAFAAAEENNCGANSCHSPLDARPPPLPASEQPPIGALFAARQRFNSWDGNGDDDNSGDRTPISHLSPSTLSPLQSAPSGDVIDALNDGCRRDLSTRPETSNEDASRRPISGDVRTSVGQSPSTPQKSSLRFSFPVTDQMNPNITTSNPSALNSRRNHRENVYEENLNGRSDVPQPPKATCDVNGSQAATQVGLWGAYRPPPAVVNGDNARDRYPRTASSATSRVAPLVLPETSEPIADVSGTTLNSSHLNTALRCSAAPAPTSIKVDSSAFRAGDVVGGHQKSVSGNGVGAHTYHPPNANGPASPPPPPPKPSASCESPTKRLPLGSSTDVLFSRMGQFDDHAEASWRGSGSPASISRPTQYRSTPAPSVQSTSNDTSAAEKVAAKKTSSPSHGLPIQLAADNSAAERKKSSFTGNTAEAGSKDRRPEADVVRIIPVVVESVPQRQPRRPSSDRPMSATTSERRYDSNDGGKRDGARNRQSPIVPQSGGFAEVRQVAPVTQGARSVPIPVTRASWSSVTSTDEFIFAPTTPVADSARVQSPLSPGARDERPKLQTSTSTTTVTRSSMFAPTSVNSHHVQQQQPSGGSASTDRSWESCAMPVGPRATTTVRPRPSTVPSSGDEPGRRVTVTTKDESKTPVKRLGNLDVNESTDTATNVVLTPPQSPGALIPVPVKHETTIPVRNAVRTNAAATIVPVQTVGSNRRESTNESTLTHTMSVMTGGSTAGNGDNVTTTRKTTTITKTHGGISSCSSSDEAMTATDGPRGSFDRTAELDEFGHGAAETFELVVVKSGLGLSFCIEGGKDSSYGDRPITVKRVFRAGEQLRPGDHILAANGRPLSMLSHYVAWNYLKSLPEGNITLLVRRPGAAVAAARSGAADSSAVPCRYVAADRNSVSVGMESESATRRTVT